MITIVCNMRVTITFIGIHLVRSVCDVCGGDDSVPVHLPHVQLMDGEDPGHAEGGGLQVARAETLRNRLEEDQSC